MVSNYTHAHLHHAIGNVRLSIVLRGIPRLNKRSLCPVGIILSLHLLDTDFSPVLGKHNVLLLQLVDAAFGELVGVKVDL